MTRIWQIKPYESYRVTVDVPIIDGKALEVEPRIVLSAARYAADRCHEAWTEYNAERNLMEAPGGDFRTADYEGLPIETDKTLPPREPSSPSLIDTDKTNLPRGKGAEQGPSHGADSPKPEPAGAGEGAGAEEPDASLATSNQLAVLEDRENRDPAVRPFVEKYLKLRGIKIAGQLTQDRMQDLHRRLNAGEHHKAGG